MPVTIDLIGRRALVTGAGQGVGRRIALTLAEAGAEVVVNDLVEERAASVVSEIEAAGGQGRTAVFDVTDWPAVEAAVTADEIAPDTDALELIRGVGNLCVGADNPRYDARRMVALLIAGLRRH